MALLFCDGFSSYATADILKKWTTAASSTYTSIDASYGRFNSPGVRFGSTAGSGFLTKTFTNSSTIIVGFALKVTGLISVLLFSLRDSTSTQVAVYLGLDGTLRFYNRNDSGTLLGTTSKSLDTTSFTYVEVKITFHDSTGSINCRFNGESVLSVSNIDTKYSSNAYANNLYFQSIQTGLNVYLDDVYICDNSGSVNNDFLGDVKIECLLPSGAGDTTQWTPSTGNNYECVDETAINSSDYVSTDTVNNIDTYAYGDLSTTSGSVRAVQVCPAALKDDAGTRSIAAVARPGSTDRVGSTKNITDAYLYYPEIWETNPDTSSAWVISEVNASKFGVKLVA